MSKTTDNKKLIVPIKIKFLQIIGWFCIFFGIIALSSPNDENVGLVLFDYVFSAIFIGFGIYVVLKARKVTKALARYRLYISSIIYSKTQSIETLATATGVPYDKVVDDLETMISDGYLKNYYVNKGSKLILSNEVEEKSGEEKTVTVRCGGCGANNVVKTGSITECQFCGAPISL